MPGKLTGSLMPILMGAALATGCGGGSRGSGRAGDDHGANTGESDAMIVSADGEVDASPDASSEGGHDAAVSAPSDCDGNWSLAAAPFTVDVSTLGATCESVGNQCRDQIHFADGTCICVVRCSDVVFRETGENPQQGEYCTPDQSWQCQSIASNDASNYGTYCVSVGWNLCQRDGNGGGGGSGGMIDAGVGGRDAGGGDPEPQCGAEGSPCSTDEDCCSEWCSIDGACD